MQNKITPQLAAAMLRPSGFHAWDYPAGPSNATLRKEVIGLAFPEMKGKRGTVPTSKAGVVTYREALKELFDVSEHTLLCADSIPNQLQRIANS